MAKEQITPKETKKVKKPAVKPVTAKNPKKVETAPEKQKRGHTNIGGKKTEIKMHPNVKRITSLGHIIESKTAVIAFGRANPPTIGHERLVSETAEIAESYDGHAMFFMSPTNNIKNPLTDTQKLSYIHEAFDDIIDVREEFFSNPIILLKALSESYDNLIWVTGSDQANDYERIIENYNNVEFTFKEIGLYVLERSGEHLNETISATQLRQAVTENDIETFTAGLPTKLKDHAGLLFEQVQAGMFINENKNPFINIVRDAFQNV